MSNFSNGTALILKVGRRQAVGAGRFQKVSIQNFVIIRTAEIKVMKSKILNYRQ